MTEYNDLPRCPVTNKVSYPDRDAALAHARKLRTKYGDRQSSSMFTCGWCGKLHRGTPRGNGGQGRRGRRN